METEGPEPDGAGFFASPQATLQAPLPAFLLPLPDCSCPCASLESSPATCHEISADLLEKVGVLDRSERAAIGKHNEEEEGKETKREKRLSGDGLAGSLAAEFLKKIILLHGGCLAQQFQQGILQVFVLREFIPGTWSGFELAQVCG
jgi:hypothetical protein